ncbi:MAG: hypothetical protein MK214_14600 [Thalassotalea sp.]|nr:hypothetical protein [Thalassotalea sp.]
MAITSLDFYVKRIQMLGVIFLAVSILAWSVDLLGIVYECPYCRVQRSVIGLLGILMIVKGWHNWMTTFVAAVIGFLGAHVAAAQNFMGWKKISAGTFEFKEDILIDPFLLSGAALFAIIAQVFLVALSARENSKA